MTSQVNDIVNDNVNLTSNNNDNVIVSTDKYARARSNDRIASQLLQKFGLPETSKGFMWKAVNKLGERRIWNHYETAQSAKKSKVGLFIWLCKRDGV